MNLPVIFDKKSVAIKVEANKKYFWCSCGLSEKQPFCDGKHREHKNDDGSIMKPIIFESDEEKTIYFCNCKYSKNKPLCDGSHSKL